MGEEGFIIVKRENSLTSSGKLLAIPFFFTTQVPNFAPVPVPSRLVRLGRSA